MKATTKYSRETIVQAGWLAAAKMMIETRPETKDVIFQLTNDAERMAWGWANVDVPEHLAETEQVLEVAQVSLSGMFNKEETNNG